MGDAKPVRNTKIGCLWGALFFVQIHQLALIIVLFGGYVFVVCERACISQLCVRVLALLYCAVVLCIVCRVEWCVWCCTVLCCVAVCFFFRGWAVLCEEKSGVYGVVRCCSVFWCIVLCGKCVFSCVRLCLCMSACVRAW